jgi:acyl-CoA thioesterase-1
MKPLAQGLALAAMIVLSGDHAAMAAEAKIVALGASNTYGMGVSRNDAYPAQLERLLRDKGIRAAVANKGINGNTTGQMLLRLGAAVPDGTTIVILQPGSNDDRIGIDERRRNANIDAIRARLRARNIKLIMVPEHLIGQIRRSSPAYDQGDGIHLTSNGYHALAVSLLPEVISAIGQ